MEVKRWSAHKNLLILLGWSVVLRLVVTFCYSGATLFPDSEGYQDLARRMAAHSLVGYEGMRTPGYPLLIVFSGQQDALLVLFQQLLGIGSVLLGYGILRRLDFSSKMSFWVPLLFSSLLHVLFYETCILTESLTQFLVLAMAWLLCDGYLEQRQWRRELLMGLLLACLVLVKPFYIFIPFLILGLVVLRRAGYKILWRKMMMLLFPLVTFLSICYGNLRNTGYFVPTTFYGFNIAQNCVWFAEKVPGHDLEIGRIYAKHRDSTAARGGDIAMSIWRAYPELTEKTKLSFPDLSKRLNDYSKVAIAQNKTLYAKQVCISWWDFFKTDVYWKPSQFKSEAIGKLFTSVWNLQHYALRLFKLGFVICAPLILLRWIRKRQMLATFGLTVMIVATSVLQAVSTYGTNARFSYPFEFLMVAVVLYLGRNCVDTIKKGR